MESVTDSLTTCTDSPKKHKCRDRECSKRDPTKHSLTAPAIDTDGNISNLSKRRNSLDEVAYDSSNGPATKKIMTRSHQQVPNTIEDVKEPSNWSRSRIKEASEQEVERMQKMCCAVRTLIECIGEDPDREGLLDTPLRYSKALLSLTQGYQMDAKSIVDNALFHKEYNGMVVVKDVDVHSLCEHHLLPFIGKIHIGYIPSDTIIGLSKLPRIAEMFSRRLQIQERITKEVAHAVMEILKAHGVAVVMESCHMCMTMRGVEKTGTTTITSCVLGCFEKESKKRDEFLKFVGIKRT